MSNFRIYDFLSQSNRNKVRNDIINFDISEYNILYQDKNINLIWNPLYLQLQFIMKTSNPNSDNVVTGGYDITNASENLSFSFQFSYNTNYEYFFSSTDGSIDQEYSFKKSWNRSTLWLKSEFNTDFPYYQIDIKSVSNNAIATITQFKL